MKAIIAGGRNYKLTPDDINWLNQIHARHKITEVVSGGATGADAEGEAWARSNSIPVKVFKADWKTHSKAAGPLRNKQMAEYADLCILFPGGRGTDSMREFALEMELVVYSARAGFRLMEQMNRCNTGDAIDHLQASTRPASTTTPDQNAAPESDPSPSVR